MGFLPVHCSQESIHQFFYVTRPRGQRERQLERWNRRRMAQEEAQKMAICEIFSRVSAINHFNGINNEYQ